MTQAQLVRTTLAETAAWTATALLLLAGHKYIGDAVAALLRLLYETVFPKHG